MDQKINILFFMTGNPYIFGGGKRVFMQIMKGLSQHTFNVWSCCSLSKEQDEELRESGVRIIETDLLQYNPIMSILKLSDLMRSENIHIVHSQGGRAVFYSRVAARLANISVVVNTSTMLVENYDVGIVRKLVYILCDRMTERFVDKFIVVSKSLRETLTTRHGIEHNRVVTLYNGIEVDQYQCNEKASERIRKEFVVREGAFLVGSVGRLVYQKGFDHLVRSVPKVLEAFPKAKFLLVGDGPLKGELEDLTKELRISENVIFAGFRDDIRDILSALDIFVLPSILEGHPVAILEAMAMERPIVATDINGIREGIENGKTGILVSPGDPEALAEAINELLKDRAKSRKMGMDARTRVKEMFNLKHQVALYEKVYQELVTGGRRSRKKLKCC